MMMFGRARGTEERAQHPRAQPGGHTLFSQHTRTHATQQTNPMRATSSSAPSPCLPASHSLTRVGPRRQQQAEARDVHVIRDAALNAAVGVKGRKHKARAVVRRRDGGHDDDEQRDAEPVENGARLRREREHAQPRAVELRDRRHVRDRDAKRRRAAQVWRLAAGDGVRHRDERRDHVGVEVRARRERRDLAEQVEPPADPAKERAPRAAGEAKHPWCVCFLCVCVGFCAHARARA